MIFSGLSSLFQSLAIIYHALATGKGERPERELVDRLDDLGFAVLRARHQGARCRSRAYRRPRWRLRVVLRDGAEIIQFNPI